MGKPGFQQLKGIFFGFIKKYGPPERVTRNRYRFGLILFIFPLLMAWTLPYIGHLLPFYQENLLTFSIAGDVLFVSSLFVCLFMRQTLRKIKRRDLLMNIFFQLQAFQH
jgi:hypothetical protein